MGDHQSPEGYEKDTPGRIVFGPWTKPLAPHESRLVQLVDCNEFFLAQVSVFPAFSINQDYSHSAPFV